MTFILDAEGNTVTREFDPPPPASPAACGGEDHIIRRTVARGHIWPK